MSENTDWLRDLDKVLWPQEYLESIRNTSKVTLPAYRKMSSTEWARTFKIIADESLICEMVTVNMFGGYGMRVYAHEQFPGTGAEFLILVHEDHLPCWTLYDAIEGTPPKKVVRVGGEGRTDAWEAFSPYTHSAQNQEWLRKYRLEKSERRDYYDY